MVSRIPQDQLLVAMLVAAALSSCVSHARTRAESPAEARSLVSLLCHASPSEELRRVVRSPDLAVANDPRCLDSAEGFEDQFLFTQDPDGRACVGVMVRWWRAYPMGTSPVVTFVDHQQRRMHARFAPGECVGNRVSTVFYAWGGEGWALDAVFAFYRSGGGELTATSEAECHGRQAVRAWYVQERDCSNSLRAR